MKTSKYNQWFLPLLMSASLTVMGTTTRAASYSLAGDFAYGSNPNGTWTYQLEVTPGDDDTAYTPMDTNTRTANEIWGTTFAAPPVMWTETSGFWGIGRNDSGETQTSPNVVWDPGEVLFHPKPDFAGSGGRFVITWTAPSDMTVDVDWTYAKRMTVGANGVGMGVLHESGGANTELRAFANPEGASGIFAGLAVLAGDKLHFRFDNWGDAGGDITTASVEITEASTEGPPLAIEKGRKLSWPAFPPGYELQVADTPEGPYSTVTGTPMLNRGRYSLNVPDDGKFYRLAAASE